ncbi:MAG: class I SAM-dependent RNA methyltransferase [Pseudomonadota bacterium]
MSHEIVRLGHRGDGIAEGPVYVARTLPGEIVDGEVAEGRIAAPRILTPSPDRVRPPCRHYKSCGGCAVMHASDDFVAAWKQEVVETALAAQGITAPFRPIATSPAAARRRATVAGRRLRGGALVGFHGRASHTVVAVPDCAVMHPDLIAALPACEELTRLLGPKRSELRISITTSAAGLDIELGETRALTVEDRQAPAEIAGRHGLARISALGEPVITARPPAQSFDGISVVPPPGAFLQATAHGEDSLRQAVVEAVGPAQRVVDVFAGCGTFALPLARRAEVHAVEGDPDMTAALDHGWRQAQGLKAVTTETRDLFRAPLLPDELNRFDAAVIDPPRAGAEAQMREIATSSLARIAAISCNPVTFARDAKLLTQAGFRLNWVQVVDQFRWSAHVELAASFTRDHMAGS